MCGHRRQTSVRRVAADAALRASQAERDDVVERLRVHAAEGRLDFDELEQRVEAALRARTRGDLAALLSDLPGPAPPRRRAVARQAVAAGALVSAVLPLGAAILLLALAPPALSWMAWPLLGWWFCAALPAAGVGAAWCGYSRRRERRRVIV